MMELCGNSSTRMISQKMKSIFFLSENRDGTIKGRMRANGSAQRSCVPKGKTSIPAMTTESVLITSVADSKKERCVMLMNNPNSFVQTKVPQGDERIIMNVRGELVDMLLKIDPEKYKDFVIGEGLNIFFTCTF